MSLFLSDISESVAIDVWPRRLMSLCEPKREPRLTVIPDDVSKFIWIFTSLTLFLENVFFPCLLATAIKYYKAN